MGGFLYKRWEFTTGRAFEESGTEFVALMLQLICLSYQKPDNYPGEANSISKVRLTSSEKDKMSFS